MFPTLIGAFALISACAAQSVTRTATASSSSKALPTGATTVSLFIPGADPQALVASVISANPSVTAYHLNCPPNADSNDCGFAPGANITVQSSSIFELTLTASTVFSLGYNCTVQGAATCTESAAGVEANFPGSSVEVIPQAAVTYLPVVVTAGAEKLTASGSGNRSATATGASRTGSATGAANSTVGNSAAAMQIGHAFTFTGLLSVVLALL